MRAVEIFLMSLGLDAELVAEGGLVTELMAIGGTRAYCDSCMLH